MRSIPPADTASLAGLVHRLGIEQTHTNDPRRQAETLVEFLRRGDFELFMLLMPELSPSSIRAAALQGDRKHYRT